MVLALSAHPDVAVAAVIGVPDDLLGEAVMAVVIPRTGVEPAPEALAEFVRTEKGEFHVPRSFEFAAELPLTAVGKPDRKVLKQRFWAGRDRRVV